jgi:hypothetical protein
MRSNQLSGLIHDYLAADGVSREAFYSCFRDTMEEHGFTEEQVETQIYKMLLGGQLVEDVACREPTGRWRLLYSREYYPNMSRGQAEENKKYPGYRDFYRHYLAVLQKEGINHD